jgi:hypothetical protein
VPSFAFLELPSEVVDLSLQLSDPALNDPFGGVPASFLPADPHCRERKG